MVAYNTFSIHRGVTPKGMLEAQDEVRSRAREFIAAELHDGRQLHH